MDALRRIPLHLRDEPARPSDSLKGRRTPFGWAAIRIGPGQTIRLTGPNWEGDRTPLRVTLALELWASGVVRAADSKGRAFGSARVDHSDTREAVDRLLRTPEPHRGTPIDLRLSADVDVFVFIGGNGTPLHAVPHILLPPATARPLPALLDSMGSTESLQQFGWKEGCVLDGHT